MKLIPLAFLLLGLVPQAPQEKRQTGIAARINGEVITWDEVELVLWNVSPSDRTPDLRRRTLVTLAKRILFLQEARNYNIEISEVQVDTALEAERRKSKYTMEEFAKYVNTNMNMTITEYRAEIKRDLTIGTLMSRLSTEPLRNPNPKLRLMLEFISPEEMRAYYDSNPAQFKPIRTVDVVFLTLPFETEPERADKERLAASIRRRVDEDSPLYVQALAYMDMNRMPSKGGKRMPRHQDLSYEEAKDHYPAEIVTLLFETLKEGEVSQPVLDKNSVNLFHLQRRIHEKEKTFEEAQPLIRRHLESRKRAYNQKLLEEDLVKRSFVEPPDLFK
jgi:hypothetical protein